MQEREREREPIRPGEPGYDDEHVDQGKQEDRLADSERGRAFLERLWAVARSDRRARAGEARADDVLACDVLSALLIYDLPLEAIKPGEAAALGRVLRESE